MNDVKRAGEIYTTHDYDKFVLFKENRNIDKSRIKKIRESIETVGFRMNPIIVNKNMEIIDGQGRYTACKELDLPILFVIDEEADIEVCRQLNLGQKNWTVDDFIKSYANEGNENYIRLKTLLDKFKGINSYVIFSIRDNTVKIYGGSYAKPIKSGKLIFTKEDFELVNEVLDRIYVYTKQIRRIGGKFNSAVAITSWLIRVENVNQNRVFSIIQNGDLPPFQDGNYDFFFRMFTKAYNSGLKGSNRIYFETVFEQSKYTNK